MSLQKEIQKKMDLSLEHLKEELKGVRTGQANPHILDNVLVEAYGAQTRIRDLAAVTTPESRSIIISPYDKNLSGAIGKAIDKANLGFTAIVESDKVRINIPPMSADLRSKMVKYIHELLEKTKVSIRQIRQDANKTIKKQKADGEIPEDVFKKEEKNTQEMTDKYCAQAEEICKKKEKEISSI